MVAKKKKKQPLKAAVDILFSSSLHLPPAGLFSPQT